MLVVGLIDIQHMQSVIKGFFFFFFFFFFFKNCYYFSDLETQWPRNPSTVIRGGKSQYWRKISLSSVSELLPLVPKGGVPRDPSVENHFPTGILQWNLHHMCMDYKKSQFWKKNLKCCTVSKWRPNNQFLFHPGFRLIRFWPKFEKPLFQRNFSRKFGSK